MHQQHPPRASPILPSHGHTHPPQPQSQNFHTTNFPNSNLNKLCLHKMLPPPIRPPTKSPPQLGLPPSRPARRRRSSPSLREAHRPSEKVTVPIFRRTIVGYLACNPLYYCIKPHMVNKHQTPDVHTIGPLTNGHVPPLNLLDNESLGLLDNRDARRTASARYLLYAISVRILGLPPLLLDTQKS